MKRKILGSRHLTEEGKLPTNKTLTLKAGLNRPPPTIILGYQRVSRAGEKSGLAAAVIVTVRDLDQGQRVFFSPGFSGFTASSAVESRRFFTAQHYETLRFPTN